jgi:hypothetical protein
MQSNKNNNLNIQQKKPIMPIPVQKGMLITFTIFVTLMLLASGGSLIRPSNKTDNTVCHFHHFRRQNISILLLPFVT